MRLFQKMFFVLVAMMCVSQSYSQDTSVLKQAHIVYLKDSLRLTDSQCIQVNNVMDTYSEKIKVVMKDISLGKSEKIVATENFRRERNAALVTILGPDNFQSFLRYLKSSSQSNSEVQKKNEAP